MPNKVKFILVSPKIYICILNCWQVPIALKICKRGLELQS